MFAARAAAPARLPNAAPAGMACVMDNASPVTMHFAARAVAGELAALAVAVVDLGGAPLFLWRDAGIGFLYADLALAKAWTAAALRRTPADTGAALKENPAAATYLAAIGGGRFAPLPGGRLMCDAQGAALCAVGVASPRGGAHDEAEIDLLLARTHLTS